MYLPPSQYLKTLPALSGFSDDDGKGTKIEREREEGGRKGHLLMNLRIRVKEMK
jgi:hypothetical protein